MGRTAQTWIVGADHSFYTVQHSMRNLFALHVMLRYLEHAAVHCQIVLTRGNDEIGPTDQPLLVNLVVMKERAARSFGGAHTLESIGTGERTNVFREDLRVVEQLLHAF